MTMSEDRARARAARVGEPANKFQNGDRLRNVGLVCAAALGPFEKAVDLPAFAVCQCVQVGRQVDDTAQVAGFAQRAAAGEYFAGARDTWRKKLLR